MGQNRSMIDFEIARPSASGKDTLKQIWIDSFGDDPDYVNFFFENKLPYCKAVTARMGGIPLGAAYLLPAEMRDGERWRKAYYVYAVGVSPAHRGCGVGAAMMKHILDFVKREDAICFLSPASEKLVSYYSRLGMQPSHFAKNLSLKKTPIPNDTAASLSDLTAEDYRALQSTAAGSVRWDIQSIRYALAEARLSGGRAVKCKMGADTFGVIGYEKDGTFFLKEIVPAPKETAILSRIAFLLGTQKIVARVPADADDPEGFVLGMTNNAQKTTGAPLGLLLD